MTKEFTGWADEGAQGDEAGDVANYKVVVTNTGNITLTNVTVKDPLTGQDVPVGSLAPGASAEYLTSYEITQEDLDTKGDSAVGNTDDDGDIDNTVTADSTETEEDTATAEAPLLYNPKIELIKYVSVTGASGSFVDANLPAGGTYGQLGPQNINIGSNVFFQVTVENKGNVTLTGLILTDVDTSNNVPQPAMSLTPTGDTDGDGILDIGEVWVSGDAGTIGVLEVGEKWTLNYVTAFDAGQHVNTAEVNTEQGVGDKDEAYYYSLVNTGPGVRTPGFWSNLGAQFWNNVDGDETKSGPNFAKGELIKPVDANNDGFINFKAGDGINDDKPLDAAGLLVGDFDGDGLTGPGEDTLFISLGDAKQLINASQKTVSGDGVQMLGRDVVATWLNYLAGNAIENSPENSGRDPKHFISDAVDWLQTWGGKDGNFETKTIKGKPDPLLDNDKTESFDIYDPSHVAVKTNTAQWQTAQFSGDTHSAAQMHNALDEYNNTGMIDGEIYAHDADDAAFASALTMAQSVTYSSEYSMMTDNNLVIV